MSTEEVSREEVESARKFGARNETAILQAVARVTQVRAAACMDVSPSTVNRMLDDVQKWGKLLAAVGLQVAPTGVQLAPLGSMVISHTELIGLRRMALNYLLACEQQDQLKETGQ
ncbi:MAG: MarR family transcriptional regulator [Paraburkholderia sp.]|jgi:hypothetical protein|nr:MarR family transcriptional regulator [Paraburkholderia sp.]